MIYFTSDTHFGHENIIKYCNRPFNSVEEMDKVLINNWNSVVTSKDLVYHLGDFCFKSLEPERYINKLNGNICLIRGNHDTNKTCNLIKDVCQYRKIKINDQKIILFHYPIRFWECRHYGSWHLYGHTHGTCLSVGKSYDVGVDVNGFKPISFNEIEAIMESK